MASTNQSPAYQKAQGKFLTAQTNEEKLTALEEMIKECPKHKSSENMLANLKTRYKKLKSQIEKVKKSGKGGKKGIRKEEMQAVILGMTNSGKSSLLSTLTNARTKISEYNFTTKSPKIGIMDYPKGVQIQLVEIPAFESEYYDKSIVNTTDIILILVINLEDITKIKNKLEKIRGKKIIVFNKIDNLDSEKKRKISATLQSKKHEFVLISVKTKEGIEELKEKIFKSFDKIRVYTKEHNKGKADKPIILDKGKTVKDVAEKILKGFSEKVKETLITGPSSKFSNQKVSLQHKLKDLDVVEFKTR